MRIVSLVPSQTELLYYLGVKPVAQTIFCVHPEAEFKKALKIGGTKKLKLEKIRQLKPDLIIANKEENERSQIETLQTEFKVHLTDVSNFENALDMIKEVGELIQKQEKATELIFDIRNSFERLITDNMGSAIKPTVLYLIWKEPFMAAGTDSFISSMLNKAGFTNVLPDVYRRYPEVSLELISKLHPDYIFLSSEPFPFKQKHAAELQLLFPLSKVFCVDGEMFSWYGNRMLTVPAYFRSLRNKIGV